MLTFLVVYSFTGKQHRIRQNNDNDDIYITSEMALLVGRPGTEQILKLQLLTYTFYAFLRNFVKTRRVQTKSIFFFFFF